MAPLKRKRPHEDPDPPPPTSTTTTTAAAAPTPTAAAVAGAADSTRRATRQTPILPPPIPTSQSQAAAAEDKRRRSSASTNPRPQLHKISETPIPIPVPPSSSSSTAQSAGQNPPAAAAAAAAAPEPRASRRKSGTAADTTAAMGAAIKEAKENVRPVTLVAPKITYQASQPTPHRTGGSLVRPSPPTSQPPITSHFRPVARQPYQHGIPATVTHVPVPVPPTSTPKQQQQQQQAPPPQQHTPAPPKPTPSKPQPQTHTQTHTKPQTQTTQAQTSTPRAVDKSAPRTDRNIDKVILGNICFRAWYPSYYGKEVLGDASVSGKSGAATAGTTSGKNPPAAGAGDGAKNQHRKGADTPILDRLYVCPVCFKYSKELVAWWGHVRMCERAGAVPGRKVYTHPRGRRLVRKGMPRQGGKKGNVAARFTEEVVTDEGEWSVWEVDGEQDVLFCQNLSLFAKLFLDNKSVFFDVRGFNYFLLVYTPPPPKPDPAATPAATADQQQQQPPRPHIVGFFSKEKMSWDNNNLACILVFPPWQRKGLGALLMGVSYEISRREGVLGGPEKPISELGRKGYKRFWGGEIARWLLGCGTNETNNGEVVRELLVDVEDCCKATWIALEDCLITLREMGVVVEGGTGPGKPPAKRKRLRADGEEGEDEDVEMEDAGEEEAEKPDVPRVRVDKEAVWAWVQANKISLEKVCDPDGFVEGYAIKEVEEDGDEE